MRKLKLFMAACALVGGVEVGWAQTDVTSTYITNADFEGTYSEFVKPGSDRAIYQPNGWTVTRTGSNGNDMTILKSTDLASNSFSAFTINDAGTRGEQTYWTRLRWGNNTGLKLSQTKTFNPGSYTLTALVLNYNNNIGDNKAQIFAGSNSATAANSNTKGDGAGWKTLTVNFSIDEATELEIGFKLIHAKETNSNTAGEQIVGVDNFVLTYTDFKAELRAVIAQAQAINDRISTLGDAINTAQGVLDNASASKSTIDGAVSTLRTAISTKLADYTGLNAAGDDITSFIVNNDFEASPTFDGTSLGSGSDPKSNATPTVGSTLLYNAKNVYQINGWELLTTETSDFARTFTMPYDKTLYVVSNNAVAGQAVTSPTNGSSVTGSNGDLLFVEANWCENAVLGVKQTIPLPAGSYRLTFDSYVTNWKDNAESRCGVSYSETTDYKWPVALNTWTNNEVDFTLDAQTDVTISMGYKKIGNVGGGSSAFLFVDNVKLTYFDPLKLAQIQWQEVHDALVALDATALPEAAEEAITTELAKEMPTSVEDCETAKAALQALIDSYDGIKAAYDKALALIDLATDEKDNSTGTKTTIEAAISTAEMNIETRTTADDLISDYNTLETARQTYVTSGAQPTADHVFDYTFKIPDAAITSANDWTSKRTQSGQQYTDAPDNTYFDAYNENRNIQKNIGTLRLGNYELTCATRSHADVTVGNIYVSQNGANLNQTDINHDGNTGGELGNGWSWTTVNFENYDNSNDITLGFYSECGSSKWAGADDFHLYYKGNAIDDVTANALKATVVSGKMNATVASTQSSALSDFESAQTFENYNALKAAIDAASDSKTAYTKLKGELDKMDATFDALVTNVYSATDYATNYTNVKDSYDDSSISTDDANAYSYGSRVTGAMPAIMLSAWKVGETAALTDASLYMNTWSTEGNSDGSDITTPFYEYWVADANALTAKTFTATVEGLTAGTNYLVTAKVRVRQQDKQTKADDDVTFQVNDEEVATAADGTQSDVRPEMYYKTVRAFGKADNDGKLTIKVVVKNDNHISWLAFKDVHYSEVTTPTDDHKSALASAISTAESKTIGFEEGEYAPYTNIDARKALVAAKAINDNVNDYTDYEVDAATTALNGANWDENEEEMNAVSDELFNGTEYGAAGWTRTQTWNNTSTGVYSVPAGTMTYGEVAYHEMPLEGNTVYKLTFGHRQWDGSNADNGGTVSVLNETSEGLAETSYSGTSSQTLQNEQFFFRTGEDDANYIFSISATSGRLTFGNVSILKAVASTTTISESDDAAPTYDYANVTLTRTLSASKWNTFSVPFDMKKPDGWTVKEFDSAVDNVIYFKDATTIKAGMPYLVKPDADVVNPTFNGVIVENTEGETVGAGDYKFAAQIYNKTLPTDGTIAYLSTDGKVKKLTSGGIKGLRAYFIIPASSESARIAFLDDDDQTTGISEMKQQNRDEQVIYDLNGRRVKTMNKGIYVVNGKKIVK